jgi:hypothetical protein
MKLFLYHTYKLIVYWSDSRVLSQQPTGRVPHTDPLHVAPLGYQELTTRVRQIRTIAVASDFEITVFVQFRDLNGGHLPERSVELLVTIDKYVYY